jgi:hypothetical protein
MSGNNPLDNRSRNERSGRIRQDRSDRQLDSIREEFGEHIAPGRRKDVTLGRLREETGKTAVRDVVRALPKGKRNS